MTRSSTPGEVRVQTDPLDAGLLALSEEVIAEHVADVMFDAEEAADSDCALCLRGVELGIWQRYGVTDPFAEEDE